MTNIEAMVRYCADNNVFWFCDLCDYVFHHRGDWARTLSTDKGAYFMSQYLASKAHKAGLLSDKGYEELSEDSP